MDKISRKTVQLSAGQFSYLDAGSPRKPLVVFLHGFPENAMEWCEQLAALSPRYHAVALDQRSYGQSPVFSEISDSSLDKLTQDVAEFIKALGQTKAHIVAHDWGSAVAFQFAISKPEMTVSLSTINGPHPFVYGMLLANSASRQYQASDYIRQILGGQLTEDVLLSNDQAGLKALFSSLDFFKNQEIQKAYADSWNRPGALRGQLNWYRANFAGFHITPEMKPYLMVKAPSMVIWGEGDIYLTTENLEGVNDVFENLELVVRVPGASHWVVHEKAGLVNTQLRALLDRH